MDPIWAFIVFPFACCCKKCGIFTRPKILEKCEQKFNSELEITALLGKIRDSYDMLKNLQDKKSQSLLKYGKESIINLDDSDEYSGPESEKLDVLGKTDTQDEEYLFSEDDFEDDRKPDRENLKHLVGEPDGISPLIQQALTYSVVQGMKIED